MKLVHLITSLSNDGAQLMLHRLLSCLDKEAFEAEVVSLTNMGPIGNRIQAVGVPVRALGMRPGVPDPLAILRLARWLREDPPHILQTWMYHADLVGGVAAKLAGGIPVVWNVRHGNLDRSGHKRNTLWTVKACARLSRWLPTRIVSCAEVSRRIHAELGYVGEKMVVIPNGFDLAVFKPDPIARPSVRRELGIPKDALIIALVGRFHPLKDHRNFIEAAARLHAELPEIHFLFCGNGAIPGNKELAGWINASGIGDRCHLLGERDDIPRINASLDIACSSSYSEGFPNVIGEAMSCGVPCVVTDAGDSALIVGNTGKVVPPKNPQALAGAWRELIEIGPGGRSVLGAAARRRIGERFSLQAVAAQYEKLYKQVAAKSPCRNYSHRASIENRLERCTMKTTQARYIIRFDDICPTMNWDIWGKVEQILTQHRIEPILAVVPDNRDANLVVGEAHVEFWAKVRSWQARGWTIGLHGYQHTYVTDKAGIAGINNRSEFAGLDEHEQESKLNKALDLFRQQKITPDAWIAPGHSFDDTTIRVLKKLNIGVVNDGFYLSPNTDSLGIIHVPQQLWRLRRMPFGLWTVCYHHNGWTGLDVERFRSDIERFRHQITGLRRVLASYRIRNRDLSDAIFCHLSLLLLRLRSFLRKSAVQGRRSVAQRADNRS